MKNLDRPFHAGAELGEFKARMFAADAYRERTESLEKSAQADRLATARLKAVEIAFDILKKEPGVFGLDDVFALAGRFIEFAREGSSVRDAAGNRPTQFHGR